MSTIFALSSGALPSAIAVVRLSGSRSTQCLRELTRKKVFPPRHMFYTKLYDKRDGLIDTAMAVHLPGPSTFTGEDTAELFVHGSRAVVDALSDELASMEDVRHANRGEFTKRAFFNGKMDHHQVRGLRDLLHAETQRQRVWAGRQMGASCALRSLRDRLADAVGRATLLIDFGEHVETGMDEVKEIVASILVDVRGMERRARGAEMLHRGLRVVLAGRPNAGKSSILNALAGRDVAIVSDVEGTTRDTIQVRLEIGGVPVCVTDTAGLRETVDGVEREGIRRARSSLADADIVVAVVDARRAEEELTAIQQEISALDEPPVLIVARNKVDVCGGDKGTGLDGHAVADTCGLSPRGVTPLVTLLQEAVQQMVPEESGPVTTEWRGLCSAAEDLELALSCGDCALVAAHVQCALETVGEMAGHTVTETVLDRLFQQFCIGK